MSASQELKTHGGPIELINNAMAEVEKILRAAAPEEGPRIIAQTTLRRVLGQAVLDAYLCGKAEGKTVGKEIATDLGSPEGRR